MSEPVPPSYTASISNPSVPPPAFNPDGHSQPAAYQSPPAGGYQPPPTGYQPQPTGYPPAAGYPPTSYGSAYPPGSGGFTSVNSGYDPSPVPPTNYATSNPEAGFGPKEVHYSDGASPILSFDDKSIRLAFIRKVFGILGLQMLVTVAIMCLFIFHEPTKDFVQKSTATYISAYVLFLVLYFVLVCCQNVAKSYPANVILLGVFTLSLSYLVGVISSFHDTKIVLLLFGMTCIISVAIMVFACQTKYDFTSCGGVLFVCALSLFLFGLFAAVLVPTNSIKFVNIVYSSLGALLFMAFLAFDTQLIMGGGRKFELSPEDYIFGALMLYVDIIYIFLFLLALFGGGNK